MSTSKRSVFQNCALLSKLVTDEAMEAALWAVRADVGGVATSNADVDDELLADKLIEMGSLTHYQAMQLKSGRSKLNLGPYIITDFIGQGGMGQVYKAVHDMMGRESAVKVLPRSKSTPEAIEHFQREIRTQARMDHPNLVRAYDAGEDGNVHYLVTEYVPGADLRKLVRSERRLSMQQAASIVAQAAEALAYAHDHGLIHRDVKPGNILVTPEGVAKVSDLGLAGCTDEGEPDPRKGKIVGTADYLAPELIRNPHDVQKTSDIYALGCTLYYAITGKVPYPGGTPSSKAKRHLEETPWHPRQFNDEVSDEFVDIIADMMEKDPSKRCQSAKEVADRLRPWTKESESFGSRQLGNSPWMSPPPPSGSIEEDLGLTMHETGSATYDPSEFSGSDASSASQISQGTNPMASSQQETRPLRGNGPPVPPMLAIEPIEPDTGMSRSAAVLLTLSISIPAALAVGIVIGFAIGALFF